MSTTDPIMQAVQEIVADVLALDLEEVHPSDRFEHDLGAGSLETLELSWQCEKRFGVKLPIQNLFPEESLITDQNGALTPESIENLRRKLPFLEYHRIQGDPRKERLMELFTVDAIAQFVRMAIADKEAAVESGSGQAGAARVSPSPA